MDRELRKRKILDIILKAYIETGEPIGSKYVSDIMDLSSATIRNVMGELEEDNFLTQPHTSAGRIPTERAYRLYVTSLLNEEEGAPYEIKRVNEELFSRYNSYTDIIDHVSTALSNLTNYTAFAIYPKDHIYMDGIYHILEQPEFSTIDEVRRLLKTIDEKDKILETMNSYLSTGSLNIRIGKENLIEELTSCSVITACYTVRKKVVGGLGIIGPVRMKYRKVVPLVRYIANAFSRMLERIV